MPTEFGGAGWIRTTDWLFEDNHSLAVRGEQKCANENSLSGRQLSCRLTTAPENWSGRWDSNPRHLRWQRNSLPTEIHPHGASPRETLVLLDRELITLYTPCQGELGPVTRLSLARESTVHHLSPRTSLVFTGKLVGVVGFEPTTPCSQSRCTTRLCYTPKNWSRLQGSNLRPQAPKASALPSELNREIRGYLSDFYGAFLIRATRESAFTLPAVNSS